MRGKTVAERTEQWRLERATDRDYDRSTRNVERSLSEKGIGNAEDTIATAPHAARSCRDSRTARPTHSLAAMVLERALISGGKRLRWSFPSHAH